MTPCNSTATQGNSGVGVAEAEWSQRADVPPVSMGIVLLTGGSDRPYALGLTSALSANGIAIDFVGSDDLDLPELHRIPNVRFRNLRGDQRKNVSGWRKVWRILAYYWRLFCYAAVARPRIFHILWNNKFEHFDRTVLMMYYRVLGKKIALTAHNVNARERDAKDSGLNRFSLGIQYRLADHIFVHTPKMKGQLLDDFAVSETKVSVIPLGINNTVPVTSLTTAEAKRRLGLSPQDKAILFFGRIAPYKGLEYLVAALTEISKTDTRYRLIVAGMVKDCAEYWSEIERQIAASGLRERIIERIEFIPDDETELYFKAADVLALPYTHIFQSGVLVLAYSFGLPVIAADVGSLREEIDEGTTGHVFRAEDASHLAETIKAYFGSDLFRDLENRREGIRRFASSRYCWDIVGDVTKTVYRQLLNVRQ